MRTYTQQKAALTRALKRQPADRPIRVLGECRRTVAEWNEAGFWPDDWARWQRALDDVFPVFAARRPMRTFRLSSRDRIMLVSAMWALAGTSYTHDIRKARKNRWVRR